MCTNESRWRRGFGPRVDCTADAAAGRIKSPRRLDSDYQLEMQPAPAVIVAVPHTAVLVPIVIPVPVEPPLVVSVTVEPALIVPVTVEIPLIVTVAAS